MSSIKQLSWSKNEFENWFAAFRQMQDPDADAVASEIVKSPYAHQVYAALAPVQYNTDLVSIKTFDTIQRQITNQPSTEEHLRLVELLNNYLKDTHHFNFSETDKATIKRASMFYNSHAIEATMILAVRSLLKQYAAYNATQVLGSTRMLPQYPHRRILATMDFVLDVMAPDALEPTGCGIRSIQKLRLVHAFIRARINLKSDQDSGKSSNKNDMEIDTDYWGGGIWQKDIWGLPINQQDMIFAIHTFSMEVIDGLTNTDEDFDISTKNDYYYAWHLFGKALGVDDAINPDNYTDGKKLQEQIYAVQFYPKNADGTPLDNKIAPILSTPLVSFIKEFAYLPKLEYVYAIVKRYNNDIPDSFFEQIHKLPVSQYSRPFMWVMKICDRLMDFIFGLWSLMRYQTRRSKSEQLAERMHHLMRMVVQSQSTWGSEHFSVNDGLGTEEAKNDLEILKKKGRPSILRIVIDTFLLGKK
jgi:hypothetical protein